MSRISAFTEWLGIRDLDAALPLALLSGAIVFCWTLPAALIPVEALRQHVAHGFLYPLHSKEVSMMESSQIQIVVVPAVVFALTPNLQT